MKDNQLLRYSRHILLPQMNEEGQQALIDSHVLIVGLGGLGSPAALYLAASGVGQLTLVDDDEVELSNLQRQIIHQQSNVGEAKVASAKNSLENINSDVIINTLVKRLDEGQMFSIVENVTAVLDCTDNFTTRYLINRVCVQTKTPLISGAAIRMEGQISSFDFRDGNSPCYACLYSDQLDDENLRCAESGVLAPLVGVIGAMQALEALKLLAGIGKSLSGRLLLFDAHGMEWREMKLSKDPACGVCGSLEGGSLGSE